MVSRVTTGWGSLARLLGAILYGRSDADEGARKKARKLVAQAGAGGLVAYLLLEMWAVTKASIYDERAQHREQIDVVVSAVEKLTEAVDRQTVALSDLASQQSGVNAILLDRIGPGSRHVPPARLIPPRSP